MRSLIERDHRLLPVGSLSHFKFMPTRLTNMIRGPNAQHLDVVDLFDGLLDRRLGCGRMHFKRKRTTASLLPLGRIVMRRGLMRAFFGHQRFLDDVVNIHRTQFNRLRCSINKRQQKEPQGGATLLRLELILLRPDGDVPDHS